MTNGLLLPPFHTREYSSRHRPQKFGHKKDSFHLRYTAGIDSLSSALFTNSLSPLSISLSCVDLRSLRWNALCFSGADDHCPLLAFLLALLAVCCDKQERDTRHATTKWTPLTQSRPPILARVRSVPPNVGDVCYTSIGSRLINSSNTLKCTPLKIQPSVRKWTREGSKFISIPTIW